MVTSISNQTTLRVKVAPEKQYACKLFWFTIRESSIIIYVVGQSVNMLVWEKKMVHFYVKFSAEQKYQVVFRLCMVLMLQRNDVQLGI